MRSIEFLSEANVDEMAVPIDWDPKHFQHGKSFKARLQYALERAKKIGAGSSRIATVIEDGGRPTVLKIAKNRRGLLQNNAEVSILNDGYASQLGILIPLIDFDNEHREPYWLQTELAQKTNEKQLCNLMKCSSLNELVDAARSLLGLRANSKKHWDEIIEKKRFFGMSEDDIDTFIDYVHSVADLKNHFEVELGDLTRARNWGLYQGKPVVLDVGFTTSVSDKYY